MLRDDARLLGAPSPVNRLQEEAEHGQAEGSG